MVYSTWFVTAVPDTGKSCTRQAKSCQRPATHSVVSCTFADLLP